MPPSPRQAAGCTGRGWLRATAPVRQAWAQANAPCALCGKPIDYALRFPHKQALTVDHRTPIWAGGHGLDPTNWQPAHHSCNASRGATENNKRRAQRRTRLAW